jgi:(p)ppGpp synthase/HD superfamily hydrolase
MIAQTNLQLHEQLHRLEWEEDEIRAVRRTSELATALFGGIERGGGRTFLEHLIGTASVLVESGSEPALVHAALLHATIGRSPYASVTQRVRSRHYRRLIRRVAGADVLGLIETYNASDSRLSVAQLAAVHGPRIGALAAANGIDDLLDGRARHLPARQRSLYAESARSAIAWAEAEGFDRLAELCARAVSEADAATSDPITTSPERHHRVLLRIGTGWRNRDPIVAIVLLDSRFRRLVDPLRQLRSRRGSR